MLNVLIQASTLVYGLVLNFLAPMLYGLQAYGEFIAGNALVFLVHRAMSIISEPLIRFTPAPDLLASSLALNALVMGLFLLIDHIMPLGSLLLLSGILLSVSVVLSMQAMRLRREYIAYLWGMSLTFSGLMVWSAAHGFSWPLVQVMEISAWSMSSVAILYLFCRGATMPALSELRATLAGTLRYVPRIISMTAVMNLLLSALPVFLGPVLAAREMGLFKVMTSVTQAATSVFPVSAQALLVSFVQHARGVEFYRLVSSIAMVYFAAACIALTTLGLLFPVLSPYVVLAASLPAFYHAILTERHLTATGHIRRLIVINLMLVVLISGTLMMVATLPQAALLYAAGFALYGVALSAADKAVPPFIPLLAVLALSPLCVLLMLQYPWAGIPYGMLVAGVALLRHVPRVADIKLLWREL